MRLTGGDGHRICYQATGRLLYNTAFTLTHIPAVPPGTCSSPSRVGKRPRMRHFNLALSLQRTFYRKLRDEQVWHFCRNCPNWPRAGYEERDNRNPPHEFCRGCIEMHHEETCEWANVELSPARSYRGSKFIKSFNLVLAIAAPCPRKPQNLECLRHYKPFLR